MKTKAIKWRIVEHNRQRMNDGVFVYKKNGFYTIYRYIDDWDEDGDTIYDDEEYVSQIPEGEFMAAIGASEDSQVIHWIKTHLIKEQSNSRDDIISFLDENNVSYRYEINGLTV